MKLDWDWITEGEDMSQMGRRCLAECLAKKYDLDRNEVHSCLDGMNSAERDAYMNLLKEADENTNIG